jgi:hypothetical protein
MPAHSRSQLPDAILSRSPSATSSRN